MTHASAPRAIVVMGVSGCGKSTVGVRLAGALGYSFIDADALHPVANVAKMAAGTPLTDDDRGPWLDAVGAAPGVDGVVVACSALRRGHRDRLRTHVPEVCFVHLHGPTELLRQRMAARHDHFMPAALLDSQLATLEHLEPDETGGVIGLADPVDTSVATALARLRGAPAG